MNVAADLVDEVEVDPAQARVYAEGWQSWSPATWYPAGSAGLAPDEEWQHTMRYRPGTPVTTGSVAGRGHPRGRAGHGYGCPLLRRGRPGRRTNAHGNPRRRP